MFENRAGQTWRGLAPLLSVSALCFAGVSCAAIGGLGDFVEVDCVGASCADGGVADVDADVDGSVDGAGPDVAPQPVEFATIGGTVTGLLGTGLVLRDNGVDDIQIGKNGSFTFPARVRNGDPYAVSVGSHPFDPSQMCVVTSGAGTVNGAHVTNVLITCSTAAYAIGGAVVGLAGGTGLVLTNNGGDDIAVPTAGGAFTFSQNVTSGATYAVAVKTQPIAPAGPCTVSGGTGTVGVTDVGGIVVNCAPGTYTVGGTVTGLTGTVVLRNNGANNLTLTSNGTFAFSQALTPGSAYAVTVLTQPGYPPRSQTCVVTSGAGTIGAANVTNVVLTCTTNTFTVGGTVTGLTGTLSLKNNGGDNLSVTANGAFTFATKIASANAYAVTVGTQPAGKTCAITSGTGTVTTANVTKVVVACAAANLGIKCADGLYCKPLAEVCCWNPETAKGTCLERAGVCARRRVECNDVGDCADGNVCCARFSTEGNALLDARCVAGADCAPGASEFVELWCDPALASGCPAPAACKGSSSALGYNKCQ